MAQSDQPPASSDPRGLKDESTRFLNLVAVSSEPAQGSDKSGGSGPASTLSFRINPPGSESRTVRYSRVGADAVAGSLARLHRRKGKPGGVYGTTAGAIGMAPRGLSSLPERPSEIGRVLREEDDAGPDREATAAAIVLLRSADAMVAGPLSADHANIPGFLAHLADLTKRAYRALRPPREIIVHPGFAQVARRFDFIQMSHHDARTLAGGATDLGILAQCLRQRHGPEGEFAITSFGGHGMLWADQRSWEIDPIGSEHVDEMAAGAAFCTGWVVARRFLGATAPKALAYARTTAARVASQATKK